MKKAKKAAYDGIIFDVDNVLIDTRRSYLDTIRWTIDIYLTTGSVPFFQKPPKRWSSPIVLSPADVEKFKVLGGFNDDSDCCYGLLIYLLNLPVKSRTLAALKKAVNIRKFARQVKRPPLGVAGITRRLGRPQGVTIERISRIFQEIYLGKELFPRFHHSPLVYWRKNGLITQERLVFRKGVLKKLKGLGAALGIATGRPRFEAVYALKRFGVLDAFGAVTTMDEIRAAEREFKKSLRKPNPFSVVRTAKQLGSSRKFLYVGDLPDDILAARKASRMISIRSAGFVQCAANLKSARQEMKKAKADFILQSPADLVSLVKA